VERLAAEQRALRSELADLERAWVASTANDLWASAALTRELRVVAHVLAPPVDRVKLVAQALRSRRASSCSWESGASVRSWCSREPMTSPWMPAPCCAAAVTAVGGKGGGRPDWAQGGAPDDAALEAAVAFAANDVVGRSP